MPNGDRPLINSLYYAFYFGTEFFQIAEILNRLRRADRLARGDAADRVQGDARESTAFDTAIQALRDGLQTPEDIAANLKPEEIKTLRDHWEAEVMWLVGIIWDKYSESMHARNKRRTAKRIMSTDPDPRVEARKTRAATLLALAGPGSIEKLLAGKKAQGGIYDIDSRLLKPGVDDDAMLRFVPPPIPEPPRSRKKR